VTRPRRCEPRGPWPWLLVLPLLLGAACGGPQELGDAGSKCFRDDDCQPGLICVAPATEPLNRLCGSDPSSLVSTVDGPPPVATGGDAAMAGSAGAATAGGGMAAVAGSAGASAGAGGGGGTGGTAPTAGSSTGGTDSAGTNSGGGGAAGGSAGSATAGTDPGGGGVAGTGGTTTEGGAT
jgi:hypothetical protein